MPKLLDSINGPSDLRSLSLEELNQLASEIRELIIEVVSRNRGHLSSNLGTVELTLALHNCFDFRRDRLIWDCGHQAYAHKIVTGRREAFATLRQEGGISGFADRRESDYDTFSFGHTGTGISAALGMACAGHTLGRDDRAVAVIGDGAIASGMAFEALNHAGELNRNLLVVLNHNRMSISRTVGAIARHLSKVRASTSYTSLKQEVRELMSTVPAVGRGFDEVFSRISDGLHAALTPGGLFVEMGFQYYGPVDGHNIGELVDALRHMKRIQGPILLHVITEKGHGFHPASTDPTRFHSSRRFKWSADLVHSEERSLGTSYSAVFGEKICQLAARDERVAAITAAMPDGTGLAEFARRFKDRYYDVGICEQHALGLAAGLSTGGMRPVFAVYSTFLQRAYDQLFHELSMQGEPVVLCIDRAGLVGSDGPTHHGLRDIACCRGMPGFVVMAPKDAPDLRRMMELALEGDSPAAIRYPRERVPEDTLHAPTPAFEVGQAETCRTGPDGAVIAYGVMVSRALDAARILREEHGLDVTVINARFACPLDLSVLLPAVSDHAAVVVAEDHGIAGGFGSALLEALAQRGVAAGHVRLAGVPNDLIPHASRETQLARCGLDGPGLAAALRGILRGRDGTPADPA